MSLVNAPVYAGGGGVVSSAQLLGIVRNGTLTNCGIDVNSVDNIGRTLIHYAASEGRRDMVMQLVSLFRVDVSKKDNAGMTPLHHAAASGRALTVKWLLTQGGAKGSASMRDDFGMTPLHYAAMSMSRDTVKYLVEIGDREALNVRDNNGKIPLDHARACQVNDIRVYMGLPRLRPQGSNVALPLVQASDVLLRPTLGTTNRGLEAIRVTAKASIPSDALARMAATSGSSDSFSEVRVQRPVGREPLKADVPVPAATEDRLKMSAVNVQSSERPSEVSKNSSMDKNRPGRPQKFVQQSTAINELLGINAQAPIFEGEHVVPPKAEGTSMPHTIIENRSELPKVSVPKPVSDKKCSEMPEINTVTWNAGGKKPDGSIGMNLENSASLSEEWEQKLCGDSEYPYGWEYYAWCYPNLLKPEHRMFLFGEE